MRRIFPYVGALVLGAAIGFFLAPDGSSPVELTEKVAACEAKLVTESNATNSMAARLNDAEAACDARVDASLADRKPCP